MQLGYFSLIFVYLSELYILLQVSGEGQAVRLGPFFFFFFSHHPSVSNHLVRIWLQNCPLEL